MTGDVLSITLWRKQQRQRANVSERRIHSEFNERFHTAMSFQFFTVITVSKDETTTDLTLGTDASHQLPLWTLSLIQNWLEQTSDRICLIHKC